MNNDSMIEQALYGSEGPAGYRFLARSPGFRDAWLADAESLCTGFGERPAGVACPECLFVRPFGPGHVALVRVADQGPDEAGRPGTLGFHLAILGTDLYRSLEADPFWLNEHLPPPWRARGALPALEWTHDPLPARTVEAIQQVLDVPYSATLLGGVQVLVEGGRLAFERTGPDPHLVRSLWSLLPTPIRAERWPATFAFGNAHLFDLVVVRRAEGPEFEGYVFEAQAGDYPEGRYELSLQSAVEAGDAEGLHYLLSRNPDELRALGEPRYRRHVLRLVLLLFFFLVLPTLAFWLLASGKPAPPAQAPAAPPTRLRLPRVEECPPLGEPERRQLAGALADLGKRLGLPPSPGTSDTDLAEALDRLDRRLGTPEPRRDLGTLSALGPMQRQLRALLWKHGVAGYDERGLNTVELVEKLTVAVAPREGAP